MKTPESYEKDEIKTYLKSLAPGLWFFSPRMTGYGANGVSDFVGIFHTHGFIVEVKRPGKKPTPIQLRRIAEAEAAGGKAFWGTADEVIEKFRKWTDR